MRILDHARFLLALVATALKGSFALRGTFLAQVAFMALNNLLFFTTWWILLREFESAGGWTLADMMALFGVSATGFGLAVLTCGGMFELGRYIADGDLDALLSQPKSVLVRALSSKSQASGLGDIASGALLLAMSGYVTLARIPVVLLAVAVCSATLVASSVVLQSAAFWLGRVENLSRRAFELVLTLSVYPPTLFDGGIKVVLFTIAPAAFAGHLPAHLIREFDLSTALVATGGALAYAVLAAFVFARGLARYESGSRFGVWG